MCLPPNNDDDNNNNESNPRITYSFCLENGVMMIPKRRLLPLIFACLCFKKLLLIKNNNSNSNNNNNSGS